MPKELNSNAYKCDSCHQVFENKSSDQAPLINNNGTFCAECTDKYSDHLMGLMEDK